MCVYELNRIFPSLSRPTKQCGYTVGKSSVDSFPCLWTFAFSFFFTGLASMGWGGVREGVEYLCEGIRQGAMEGICSPPRDSPLIWMNLDFQALV